MTMGFGDAIIRVITSAPKKVYKQVTYRLLVRHLSTAAKYLVIISV